MSFKPSADSSSRRLSKNRPLEISSKRPKRDPCIAPSRNFRTRDPRFDSRCGQYDPTAFSSSYSFLDDLKQREISKLRKALKRVRRSEQNDVHEELDADSEEPEMADAARDSPFEQLSDVDEDDGDANEELSLSTAVARRQRLRESRERLEQALRRLEDQRRSAEDVQRTRSLKRDLETRERDCVTQGKRPFFQKKSELKRLLLADKFKRLKESGRLAKYIQKLHRRRTQRDRRRDLAPDLPPARRTDRH